MIATVLILGGMLAMLQPLFVRPDPMIFFGIAAACKARFGVDPDVSDFGQLLDKMDTLH